MSLAMASLSWATDWDLYEMYNHLSYIHKLPSKVNLPGDGLSKIPNTSLALNAQKDSSMATEFTELWACWFVICWFRLSSFFSPTHLSTGIEMLSRIFTYYALFELDWIYIYLYATSAFRGIHSRLSSHSAYILTFLSIVFEYIFGFD